MTDDKIQAARALCDRPTACAVVEHHRFYSLVPQLLNEVERLRALTINPGATLHGSTITEIAAERDGYEAALLRIRDERDALRTEVELSRKHPHAPERCPACNWTNGGLMNYGEPDASRWLCHGCAARTIAEVARMRLVFEAAKANREGKLMWDELAKIVDDAALAAGSSASKAT